MSQFKKVQFLTEKEIQILRSLIDEAVDKNIILGETDEALLKLKRKVRSNVTFQDSKCKENFIK